MEFPLTNVLLPNNTRSRREKRGVSLQNLKNHDVNIRMWNFCSCAVLFTLTECNPWRRCNIFNVPTSVMIGFIYIKNHANQQTCVIVVKMRLKLKRKDKNTARIREREAREEVTEAEKRGKRRRRE